MSDGYAFLLYNNDLLQIVLTTVFIKRLCYATDQKR